MRGGGGTIALIALHFRSVVTTCSGDQWGRIFAVAMFSAQCCASSRCSKAVVYWTERLHYATAIRYVPRCKIHSSVIVIRKAMGHVGVKHIRHFEL